MAQPQTYAVAVDDHSLLEGPDAPPVKVDGLYVRFHQEPVENKLKSWGGTVTEPDGSEKRIVGEGRPIYDEIEFIEIVTPGDRSNIVDRRVTDLDRRKYAQQYKAWKSGDESALSGTPLSKWPGITRAQVEELKYFHVRTVEQLADLSDGNIQNIGPVRILVQRAKDFLEAAKGAAPAEALRAQLSARDNEVEVLKRQLKEQGEAIAQLQKAKK